MPELASLIARRLVVARGAPAIDETIRAGEIVGLAGLDGHGQERFLTMLAGLAAPVSGDVALRGPTGERRLAGLRQAVAAGVAYLPRDRRANGIFPTQSVLDNFAIATLPRDTRFGLIGRRSRRARYEVYRERLGIVAPAPDAPITSLSGGNQQKVLLARMLALEPAFLLLNDPTRGVDVATRKVLYDVFRGLAAEGMGLVILSSEIEEILLICHRVLVFREQGLAAELAGPAMTAETVIAGMFGRAA